jgi:AraC-like DNA-binding protein
LRIFQDYLAMSTYESWWLPQQPGTDSAGLSIASGGHFDADDHVCATRVRPDHLLLHVNAGRGRLVLEGRERTVEAGRWFWLAPGQEHAYAAGPGRGWDLHFVHFAGPVADRTYRGSGLEPATAVRPSSPAIDSAFRAVVQSLLSRTDARGLRSLRLLYGLLLVLVDQERARHPDEERIAPALALGPADVGEMARACDLSPWHFTRLFKRVMGRTPWRWVLERRTEQARELLAGTDLPVKEVAARCGFADPDYFGRFIKRETGMSPRGYRRLQHQDTEDTESTEDTE